MKTQWDLEPQTEETSFDIPQAERSLQVPPALADPPSGLPGVKRPSRLLAALVSAGFAGLGAAGVIAVWAVVASLTPGLPAPMDVLNELRLMFNSGFHDGGPNDQGIFLQLGASLGKVFAGFGLAAVIGVPAGFAVGAVPSLRRALNPVIQVLRPVSPLAWFPIALVLFKDGVRASVFTIAITALWPMLINTAMGAGSIPRDHRNVARIFQFSKTKYLRHVLMPYSMTSVLTGMRLSMGIAWMVIVATEMLAGSGGVGFFVWDSYNNNNLAAVLSAIVLIGLVGFCLDAAFSRLAARLDYANGV